MASFSHASNIFEEYSSALGLWPTTYYNLVREVEGLIGAPIHTFDFAYLSSALEQVPALLVHDPADAVTPFANALRYHAYWPDSRLLRAGGGHHLGLPAITNSVLDFTITGDFPDNAETRQRPVEAEHELVRFFAGVEI